MKLTSLVTLAGLALLSGCGADTAASVAAGAAIRKQEMEQAQKTIEQAKEKIDQAMQLERERAIAGQ
jgi:cellobiose-specific phosphotransferase system component IIA